MPGRYDVSARVVARSVLAGDVRAALLASSASVERSSFRGFQISRHDVVTRAFVCDDCANPWE